MRAEVIAVINPENKVKATGIVTVNTNAFIRANVVGVTGMTPSSLETPLKKVTMFGQPFAEVPLHQTKPSGISSIEEVKKAESYNPSKRSRKGYFDKDGRWVIRKRGRSGCRCPGDEKVTSCRSRRCRNENKGAQLQSGTTKKVNSVVSRRARSSIVIGSQSRKRRP